MHFSLATIIAVVPFLVSASPLAKQPHSTISLVRKSNLHQDDGSINADNLKRHLAASVNKFERGFETYQRKTGKRHPLQPDVAGVGTKRDVIQEDLVGGPEQYWQGSIQVGTPAQDFWVEIDTTTSDLIIPHDSCKDTACTQKFRYKSGASSTSKALEKPFSIEKYHTVASGDLYTDVVTIGHSFSITNQTLGAATHYGKGFSDDNWTPDGLLGLGFPIISVFDEPTVFEQLVANGEASKSVFALKLNGHDSELTLGGLNPNAFKGQPIYTPVTQDGFWQIKISSFKVGDEVVPGPTHALVDSGTKFVVGPKAAVKAIYARIKGSEEKKGAPGFFTFPCASRIPPISITLGDNELFMEPDTVKLTSGTNTCTGSIVYEETFGTGTWILGDSWMANFYTIFDYGKKQIGFATPTPVA